MANFFKGKKSMSKKKLICAFLSIVMLLALIPAIPVFAADQTTVNVDTVEEFIAALASDTKIVLSGKRFSFPSTRIIVGMNNLSIVGTEGTELVIESTIGAVLAVISCDGFFISNVYMGHDVPSGEGCGDDASVISIYDSTDVIIDNCDLYGCGRYGFAIGESSAAFRNTIIRDCSDRIGHLRTSVVAFNDCSFNNNGYANDSYGRSIYGRGVGALVIDDNNDNRVSATFNNCKFNNNKCAYFKSVSKGFDIESFGPEGYDTDFTKVNDCTFTGNAWETQPASIPPANVPDLWAVYDVASALEKRLVPQSILTAGWKNPTTRLAAAEAMVMLLEVVIGKKMEVIAEENGWDLSANQFSDTDSKAVTFLRYAGVVKGDGVSKYDPNGVYTRAAIVTMVGQAAELILEKEISGENTFSDVPEWAAKYVGYAQTTMDVKGDGAGSFDPDRPMSNQEAVVMGLKAYFAWRPAGGME